MRRTRFALRSLAKRALHDRLVLVATAISVLCALVLIAAGPIYARGVSTATLRRQLTDLDVEATTATVTVRSPVAHLDAVDAVTRPVLDTLNTDVGGDIVTHATTGSFSLPGRESELTVLRWAPGVDESVTLAEGRWPGTGAATVEVVTSAGAASAAGLAVGDTIELGAQRSLPNLEVVVVGLFDSWPDDLIRPGDELLRSGVDQGGSFTTIGPLVVGDPSVLPADAFVDLEWWVRPDLAAVDDANVDALREQATSLERDVDNALRRGLGGSTYRTLSALDVRTGLDAALAASERSLTVTRANVMAVLIQISLLAGFAIVLTAELVAATRTDETILSHARGAGRRTIVGAAVAEALAVVVPLAIVAPWIAARALQGLEVVGPIAEIDLNLDLAVGGQAWTAVTVAALFATGFLVWPAAGIVSTDLESSRRNRRSSARARFQRAGVDLALVVIALVAVWQLRELGSRRSERADGAFGVDPLLVVAPAVATLAGGVLALRVIPVAARLGEAIAARRRSAVAALTAWQVARRPRRHTRSALLLVLAVAIGFFAATYSATWRQSQEDQSRHQVGSDARVTPDRRVGEAIPDINLIAEAEALDNVGAVIGVERRPADLPAASRPGQVLLMDAAVAAEVVDVVGVAPAELDGLMAALTEHRPTPVGITIDGVVDAIGVDVIVDQPIPPVEEPPGGPDEEDPDGEDVPPAPPEPPRFDGRLDLVVVDGRGSLHRLAGPRLAVEGATERVTFDVTGSGGLRIDPPLTLLDFEVRSVMPTGIATPVSLAISGVLALDGDTWRAVPFDSSDGTWRLDRTSNPTFARQPGSPMWPTTPMARSRSTSNSAWPTNRRRPPTPSKRWARADPQQFQWSCPTPGWRKQRLRSATRSRSTTCSGRTPA